MKTTNCLINFILLVSICISGSVNAQLLTLPQIDSMANKAINTFNVPGMSVVIVKDGRMVYARGYGVRSIATQKRVDENTLFGIASNSKAFTSAALGMLVNEGKINWDDKVTKYLPEFKMYDDYVTQNFTIRDLLTHRSGLGLGAGDLLHNPDSTDFTMADIIRSLRYLKPARSFRSGYAYDNILYLVAGELIARVSGMSWGDFIEKRIMKPLQMDNSGASYARVKTNSDIIDGHREVNGKLETIPRTDEENDAGAGGIYSSAADMGTWMLLQLNNGKYGPGLNNELFSPAIHKEMWTPQTIIPVTKPGIYNTHFGAYGLGWFLLDVKGYLQVEHTGQDDGMISEVSLIPELNLGIAVFTNQEGGGAVRAVIDQLTDSYLGITGTDHIQEYVDRIKRNDESADTVLAKIWQQVGLNKLSGNKGFNPSDYTGTYHDNWFGDITISVKNKELYFISKKSRQLKGELQFYKNTTWVVKWDNPQLTADAFINFKPGANGKIKEITMERLSEKTNPGFDFQDLHFYRIN